MLGMATAGTLSFDTRQLRDLSGIGKSIAASDGDKLYRQLCTKTGVRQDPCVLDTFRCAVAQARNPHLPAEQRNWWWWSRRRKSGDL